METFQEYLETLHDEKHQHHLQEIIEWVQNRFPELTLKIMWNQPMFVSHGTFIIGFSASKKHFSISPEVQTLSVFKEKIVESGYSHGSNLFRILWTQEVNYALLEEIIMYNCELKKDCTTFWWK